MARIPDYHQGFAKQAMLWLSFATRPLKLTELCEALAFNESDATVDQSDRLLDTHDLLRWCQGLITCHPRTSYTTLSHSSVRDYLLSGQIQSGPSSISSIDETMAERLLLRKCLAYMMFTDFGQGFCPTYHEWEAFSNQWPLLNYAAGHWASHAHVLDDRLEPHDMDLISNFFSTSSHERGGNFAFWVQCLCPKEGVRVVRDTQPLYYAASYGLRAVVGSLICANRDIDLDAPGGRFSSTALQVACYRGHYGVVEDLLDAGANPYHKDRHGRSTLFWALCCGGQDIAELVRQHLRSRINPKGETAAAHIAESFANARRVMDARQAVERLRKSPKPDHLHTLNPSSDRD